jgi:hypothetical protein
VARVAPVAVPAIALCGTTRRADGGADRDIRP